MKSWMWGIVLVVIALLAWGVYALTSERNALDGDWEGFQATVAALHSENAELKEKIEYLKQPENILKELKSQFNYTEAGEKLLIVIPPAASTSTNATSTRN
ncbi:MAG: septum formation initiator family protein [Candidatus Jorgensenbacteria bacterium]